MKINCGPSLFERIEAAEERKKDWHDFFTILPRRIAPGDCRWLETIQRKGKRYAGSISRQGVRFPAFWIWEYRSKA